MSRLADYLNAVVSKLTALGKPHRAYYRNFLSRQDYRAAVGGLWDEMGSMQLERLKMHGLKPSDTLLDFGCGSLRAGRFFIDYLNAGNYWGMDISDALIEAGKAEADMQKQPHLIVCDAPDLHEVKGTTFDYIHAHAVLSHMPEEDIRLLFKNLPDVMREGTQFLATFLPGTHAHSVHQGRKFLYPQSFFEALCTENGLTLEIAQDMPGRHSNSPLMKILKLA